MEKQGHHGLHSGLCPCVGFSICISVISIHLNGPFVGFSLLYFVLYFSPFIPLVNINCSYVNFTWGVINWFNSTRISIKCVRPTLGTKVSHVCLGHDIYVFNCLCDMLL